MDYPKENIINLLVYLLNNINFRITDLIFYGLV